MRIMNSQIIIKILENRCTADEREAFFHQINSDSSLMQEYIKAKNEYVFSHLPYNPDYKIIKKNIFFHRSLLSAMSKIAAILFIPLFIYFIVNVIRTDGANQIINGAEGQKDALVHYSVNNGVKGTIELPDGSLVYLNSGSELTFPAKFSVSEREVYLSGEGYFKVVKNAKWPLIVKTDKNYSVMVTGTEFNLSCYKDDEAIKLTLVSGKVMLISDITKEKIDIKPNEEIVVMLNKHKNNLQPANINYATAWKDGELLFENTPMPEVIKRIERWYGVEVNVANPEILEYKFTAGFDSESVNQVLETLSITSNISYSINGRFIELQMK